MKAVAKQERMKQIVQIFNSAEILPIPQLSYYWIAYLNQRLSSRYRISNVKCLAHIFKQINSKGVISIKSRKVYLRVDDSLVCSRTFYLISKK